MRIQGLQFKGLRIPPGEQRLDLDAGYNVVVAGEAAAPLLRLFVALLYPDVALVGAGEGLDPESSSSARAILGIAEKSENYRVVADLGLGRVALARYDPVPRRYERVARDAEGVAARLQQLGLPGLRPFLNLHVVGPPRAGGAEPIEAATPAPPPAAPQRERADALPSLGEDLLDEDEAKKLWVLRERAERMALDLETIEQELAAAPWLAPLAAAPDFQRRASRLRSMQDDRSHEQAALEAARQGLLAEREPLAIAPRRLRLPLAIALGASGAAAALGVALGGVGASIGFAAAGLGLLASGVLAGLISHARRRLGVIDARLVALRVKEGSFDTPLPDDLQQLARVAAEHSLPLENLRRQVSEYRRLERRAADLRGELEDGRRELGADRLRLLEEFEAARRASGAPPPVPAPPPQQGPRSALAIDLAAARGVQPEQLVAVAVAESRRSSGEVRELLSPVLPLYVRALTAGRCSQLMWLEGDGWCAEREGGRWTPVSDLAPDERTRVTLALRLTLLEVLAPSLRVPLLVGPGVGVPGEDDAQRLARVLARLGSALQVIQFCVEPGPFAGQARAVHRLST